MSLSSAIVNIIFDTIKAALRKEEPVKIEGLGTLRTVYNYKLQPVVKFRMHKALRKGMDEYESQS